MGENIDDHAPSRLPSPSTWSINGRTYTVITLALPAHNPLSSEPGPEPATIACLINPLLVPSLPSPLPHSRQPPPIPSFAVRPTSTKGAGMFATRPIPAGELIVVEHPALILPAAKFPDEAYEALGAALPEGRRREVISMADCRGREECTTVLEGVVRTNALVLELGGEDRAGLGEERDIYGGVYPFINRCNHSCGPNAAVKWDRATLSSSLYALRDISAGEEIFKSYINPVLPRASRTRTLQTNYRFSCDCPWCDVRVHQDGCASNSSDPFTPEELVRIQESDARREQLGTWIFTHLGYKKWCADLCRADDLLVQAHMEALRLVEVENVYALQTLFIEEIAMAYATLGDVKEFRRWGGRLVQLCRVEDPGLARKFEGWLEDPERRVRKWAWRRKQRELMKKAKAVELPLEDSLFLDLFQIVDD